MELDLCDGKWQMLCENGELVLLLQGSFQL